MANGNVYGGNFCSPDEQQIATIGTGYVANFLSTGNVSRTGATLTNKRIYFSGKVYSLGAKGGISATEQQNIVNVRDVTGTGYIAYKPLSLLIWGFVFIIAGASTLAMWGEDAFIFGGTGLIVSIFCIIAYFIGKKTLLSIEYAGGNIAFDTRWLAQHEGGNFIRDIHLAKDKLYSRTAAEQGLIIEKIKVADEETAFCECCNVPVKIGELCCDSCRESLVSDEDDRNDLGVDEDSFE